MRIYLSVDLEGVNGVLHSSQTQPGEPGYERAVHLMHEETNAVIDGLTAGGATAFAVNDSHYDMRNLRIELLGRGASLINGWQKPFSMMSGVGSKDEKVEAACFVGYHARAGSQCGVLSHTYRAQIFFEVKLNGKPVGETGLNGYLAGFFGVPIMLVTGDDVLCKEAKELMPGVATVEVKKAVSRYSANCPPFNKTLALLKARSEAAVRDQKSWVLLKPPQPSILTITMFDPAMADAAELLPEVKRLSARTIELTHDDYSRLFRMMLSVGVLGASRRDPHFS